MCLAVAARLLGRMAAVAIRAQHAALLDLCQQVGPTAEHGDYGYLAELVSQVVEIKNDRISFTTQFAGVLAQIGVHVRSIAMSTSKPAPCPLDALVVGRSTPW